jgi:hypothetical protein
LSQLLPPPALGNDSIEDLSTGFEFRRAGHTGVGVVNGSFLSGFSLKHLVSDHDGIQLSIGVAWNTYRYWQELGVGVSLDYVHHPDTVYDGPRVSLGWNIGMGVQGRVLPLPTEVKWAAGVHLVAGFEVLLTDAPVDLVFEYRPGVIGVPGPGGLSFAFGDISAHIRWWMRQRPTRSREKPKRARRL